MNATSADQTLLAALRSQAMAAVSMHPVIVVAATGTSPEYCWPMPREPMPATGFEIDADFALRLVEAWNLNHAVHDGAVLALRDGPDAPYLVAGWSYRLGPPPARQSPVPNRGSAYNSAAAMSEVAGVDAIFLKSGETLTVFVEGLVDFVI